jgi:hypothetical protein
MVDRLIVVTRSDLTAGQQAVQGMHSIVAFIVRHPIKALLWFLRSNTLAFVTVPTEDALGVLLGNAREQRVAAAGFHEPDRGGELTAICLAPQGAGLTKRLPLALKHHAPPREHPPTRASNRV